MPTSIALLRGINVGGKNSLPMKELAAIMASVGCTDVRTYIQSGNVVFRTQRKPAALLGGRISDAIEIERGFRPHVQIISAARLAAIIARNPFPKAERDPKSLHVSFLAKKPKSPDLDAVKAIAARTERFELIDDAFYLHAPDGIGRFKLAANAEKLLGVPATARNWRTVMKLHDMAASV